MLGNSTPNNENQQFEFLDLITILGFALQVENYEELKRQATTDDIMNELHSDVELLRKEIAELKELITLKLG